MKKLLIVNLLLVVLSSFGRTLEQEYSYAAELMEMVEMSPEWDDCPDETDTEEIEILYPTMGSLFAAQLPSNSCAYTWSALERQEAFDSFLLSFSTTNAASLARKDDHAGFISLMFCLHMHVKRSGSSGSVNGGCRIWALTMVSRRPCLGMSDDESQMREMRPRILRILSGDRGLWMM